MFANNCDVRLPIGIPFVEPPPRQSVRCVASDNLTQKPHRISIPNSFFEGREQDRVTNRVEELPHVALERPASSRIVATFRAKHTRHACHSFMRPFSDPAGIRGRNKSRLEDRVQRSEYSVMQNPVAHHCLVYPAALWVVDPKAAIRAVLICFIAQVAVQLKNMLLNFLLELGDVRLVPLVAFEYLPRRKEVLCGNY